jgi:sugar phosphate isomerase/epimerase
VEGIYQGPEDIDARVKEYIRSVKTASRFNPEGACLIITGKGGYPMEKAKGLAVRALKKVAKAIQKYDGKIALEPLHPDWYQNWTTVFTIPEALEVVEQVDEPNLGIFLDTWHIWVDKDLERNVKKAGDRIFAVQMDDWREPTRSWDDRAIPGRGIIPLGRIFKAIEKTGYKGSYNLEIIQSGNYPDSIHKMDYKEVISESQRAFEKAWKD